MAEEAILLSAQGHAALYVRRMLQFHLESIRARSACQSAADAHVHGLCRLLTRLRRCLCDACNLHRDCMFTWNTLASALLSVAEPASSSRKRRFGLICREPQLTWKLSTNPPSFNT